MEKDVRTMVPLRLFPEYIGKTKVLIALITRVAGGAQNICSILLLHSSLWSCIIGTETGRRVYVIRLFEFRDLDNIMEIWLEGNLQAHAFIGEEHWKQNYEPVKSVLPNAEVYVYEEAGEIRGFIGMDADYIAGLFVKEEFRGRGIGRQLIETVKRKIETVKRKQRLSLHVYERNSGAVAFYRAAGFKIQQSMTEKETGEKEYLMVYGESE